MRQFYIVSFVSFLLAILPDAAHAEISFAVVDIQKIMTESESAKSIQKQVQSEREKLQSEFSGYEEKLRANEKELMAERGDLTPEDFKSKRDQFQKDLQETGALVQTKKRNLERAMVEGTGKLRDLVLEEVARISEERNYDVVMTRQNIVLVTKTLDITDEVLAAVNAKSKNISLDLNQ